MGTAESVNEQLSAIAGYRAMSESYLKTGYFEQNRERLASAARDRENGVDDTSTALRDRLIIEAFAQAYDQAVEWGENTAEAFDKAARELNELVNAQDNVNGVEFTRSGYRDRNADDLTRLLAPAARGEALSPGNLRTALQRAFIEEHCHAAVPEHTRGSGAPDTRPEKPARRLDARRASRDAPAI